MADAPVLITGGAGFIGSNLVPALLANGHCVRILDDLSTGKRSNLPLDNPKVELIEGDVADATVVAKAMAGCSAVVHLAAVASVQASVDDPVRTHQSNFIGTLNVCEAMREAGVKRVVFASSAAVYGNNGEGESIVEDTPKAPLTPYASDKLASEYYLDFYRRQHGLEPVVFRFFNIYGPHQDPSSPYSGVISIFCERAEKGLPITIFGDGEQTRDFMYVGDLVKILVQAVETDKAEEGAINVGLNKATTLNQMLAALSEVVGELPPISHGPARSGDIRHSRADKLASEYYLDFYRRQHGLEPVIFRFFNIYGPHQDPSSPYSGVISIFCERAEKGLPITIFGDGEQTRDFMYVGDLVKILVQAVETDKAEEGAINVGLNKATTLNQMLAALSEVVGELPPISHGPARSGDIRHSRADNSRLLQRFTLGETTPMSVGLARLLGR